MLVKIRLSERKRRVAHPPPVISQVPVAGQKIFRGYRDNGRTGSGA
jgi:hypothetical protein